MANEALHPTDVLVAETAFSRERITISAGLSRGGITSVLFCGGGGGTVQCRVQWSADFVSVTKSKKKRDRTSMSHDDARAEGMEFFGPLVNWYCSV